MVWKVTSTNVLSARRQDIDNLTTDEVYTFIFNVTPSTSPKVIERVWLDLVTTGEANLGIYKFAASASE